MAGNANPDTVPVAFWMGSVQDERFAKLLTLMFCIYAPPSRGQWYNVLATL